MPKYSADRPRDRDRTPTRMIRLPLPDSDTERMDAATAELESSIEEARRCTEEVQQFAADIDSDKISTDGVVLDPFEEEDTIVRHYRALRALGA